MNRLVIISMLLCSAAVVSCQLSQEPGSFSMTFQWDIEPASDLYLWVRVEERLAGAASGPILASAGPSLFIFGEPFSLTMESVDNGTDRVVVVEAREGESAGLPVLYYGISEPFSLSPGLHAKVDVPMSIQTPEADDMEATVELLFPGLTGDSVAENQITDATIQTRSSGAVAIAVANDASFTANLRTLQIGDTEFMSCSEEADGEITWHNCEITGWNLLEGLPSSDGSHSDGLYSIYVKFQDKNGYESQIYKDSAVLDSQAPLVVVSSVAPPVAHAGETVVLSVTFHEALHEDPALALLTVLADGDSELVFTGPQRIGNSTSYIWSSDIPELEVEDLNTYTFAVNVQDLLGNTGETQQLVDSDDNPIEFAIDALPPQVSEDVPLTFNESLFAIEGEGLHDDGLLSLSFAMEERSPHKLETGADNLCIGICPEVRLNNKKLGTVSRDTTLDAPNSNRLGFFYQYEIDSTSWGSIEQQIEVSIHWSDLAGNNSSQVLPAALTFDFKRPDSINCVLSPKSANAGDKIIYQITVSENLFKTPELSVESELGDLFTQPPSNTGDGFTYTWEQDASTLAEGTYSVSATLQDFAGNTSKPGLAVCALTGSVDAQAPTLDQNQMPAYNKDIFGIQNEEDLSASLFTFNFVLIEADPPDFPADAGPCDIAGCPAVSVANMPVGAVSRLPELDNASQSAFGFSFEYTVLAEDWGELNLPMDVVIYWGDKAGNLATIPLPEPVVFDFIRPTITNCALVPAEADASTSVTYSITSSEPLSVIPPILNVVSETPGLFGEETLKNQTNQSFSWVQPAAGIGFATYQISTVLIDVAGNVSGGMNNDGQVCIKSGLLDSAAPALWDGATPGYQTKFGLNEEDNEHKDDLKFDFWMFEHAPDQLTPEAGPCIGNCPIISIGGQEVGTVFRKPENDPETSVWGFRFEYDVNPLDWGDLDASLEVAIMWSDKAGNKDTLVLPDSVHFDFIRPTAEDCVLGPDPAGQNDLITYGFSASEAMEYPPQLTVPPDCAGILGSPEVGAGGLTYSWAGPADNGAGDIFTVETLLRDDFGNWSDGPVCALDIDLDLLMPQITTSTISTDPAIVENEEVILAANGGDLLKVSVTIEDNRALGFPPLVQLNASKPIAFSLVSEGIPENLTTTYEYELLLDEGQHKKAEGSWPIRVSVSDDAGNTNVIDALEGALVRLDFTPPKAECMFNPAPDSGGYKVGDVITILVSPYEGLASETLPVLDETFEPPLEEQYFTYKPPYKYRFEHMVLEGEGEHYATVKVRLKDLVGNETDIGANACTSSSLNTLIDGHTPTIQSVEIVDLGKPYAAGDILEATIVVDNTDNPPMAHVGEAVLDSMGGATDLGNGLYQWTYKRLMTGLEDEGQQKIMVSIEDSAGNQSGNAGVEPQVVLDFTPPEAQCILNLDAAMSEETVRLTLTFSEPLEAAGPVVDSELDFAVNEDLSQPDSPFPKYVFDYLVEPKTEKKEWLYLVTAKDWAGNPKLPVTLCSGGGLVDGKPVKILDSTVTVEFQNPLSPDEWIDAGLYARNGSRITAVIAVDELPDEETLEVQLGGTWLTDYVLDPQAKTFTFTHIVDQPNMSGTQLDPLTVTMSDTVGNETFKMLALIVFDYDAPELAGTPYFERCDGYSDARLGQNSIWSRESYDCTYPYDPECLVEDGPEGGAIMVNFALNESTQGELLSVTAGNQELVVDECLSSENYIVAYYTPTGDEPEGKCVKVKALAKDAAGNGANLELGCLWFDFTPPASPAAKPLLTRLYRNPWGSEDTIGQVVIRVEGCPGWDFCPENVAPAAEAGTLVRVYDTLSGSNPVACSETQIAEGYAGDSGEFEVLVLADQPVVCLSQVDYAGNEGPKQEVKLVRWIGTLKGKIVDDNEDNPHDVYLALPASGMRPATSDMDVIDVQEDCNGLKTIDGTIASLSSAQGSWEQFGPRALAPASGVPNGVWVSSRQEIVLFGGQAADGFSNETWAWNGQYWRQLCSSKDCLDSSPSARAQFQMVYEPNSDKVYVFGGYDTDWKGLNDLWVWDGSGWQEIEQQGAWPPARLGHQMAVDEERGVLVLFGGALEGGDNNPSSDFSDTWEFDGINWIQVCTTPPCSNSIPAGRYSAAMTWDSTNKRVLLYGGMDHDGGYNWWRDGMNDMWSWDGTAWTKICSLCLNFGYNHLGEARSGMRQHQMTWDSDRELLVVFGGKNIYYAPGNNEKLLQGYVFEWSETSHNVYPPPISGTQCTYVDHPCDRDLFLLTYDPLRKETVLFGGIDWHNMHDDTWVWHDGEWHQKCTTNDCLSDAAPAKRSMGAAFDPIREEMVIFGDNDSSNETWTWNGNSFELKCTEPPCSSNKPAGKHSPNLAWDSFNERTILSGGSGQTDTWAWDGSMWTPLPGATYASKSYDCMVFDSTRNVLINYGGMYNLNLSYNQVWEWDVTADTGWVAATGNCHGTHCKPESRNAMGCAYSPDLEAMVMFGGFIYNVGYVPNNFYHWDGSSWAEICPHDVCDGESSPDTLIYSSMAYNSLDKFIYLFGGTDDAQSTKGFYRWNGQNIVDVCNSDNCRAALPPARNDGAMVYDDQRHRLIVFGGYGADGELNDIWEWKQVGVVPYMAVSFNLTKARALPVTGADPQTKILRQYGFRSVASGTGYTDEGKLDGYRIFAHAPSKGPWVPIWETAEAGLVDTATANNGAGLVIDHSWDCETVPPFDPAEDPTGSGSRLYCAEATHESIITTDGKAWFLFSPRSGGGIGFADVSLDYAELTIDYYRTGCYTDSVDNTPCDDGDPETEGETCQSGECSGGQ